MNHINKTNNVDPIAEARKLEEFTKYSQEAEERIRLAQEVYQKRKELGSSQAELARRIKTTQRIISDIENADLNIGFALLNRLSKELFFDEQNWRNIFKSKPSPQTKLFSTTTQETDELRKK